MINELLNFKIEFCLNREYLYLFYYLFIFLFNLLIYFTYLSEIYQKCIYQKLLGYVSQDVLYIRV